MKFILNFLIIFTALSSISYAQDLLQERIWKISSRKRSVYFDKGVFHSDNPKLPQQLKSIRNSYIPSRGYERIVFDFTSNNTPKIYGKISGEEKKVYIDFFNTTLATTMDKLKNIKYLKNIDFFTLDEGRLSVELNFERKVSFDIFYLTNPGRLVIDVKK